MTDNYSGMTGLIVGELYRKGGEWKFNAIGQPVIEASRLQSLINLYMCFDEWAVNVIKEMIKQSKEE